jgi:threonine/homoserine/homoserine lactone efflux protein
MLSLTTVAIFAGACLALTATPGPDMLLVASRSVSQGRSAGFASLAGILVGTYCHALVAAFGLSQLFVAVPMAYNVVRFAGAAYLAYLAWKTIRSKGTALSPDASLNRYPVSRIFQQGLITNLLNPKVALFVLALFPQFVRPEAGSVALQIMVLATVLNIIGFCVNGSVILMASKLSRKLMSGRRPSRVPQHLLGGVFAGLACRLALASRN